MLSEKMVEIGRKRSAIRELFEYGKARAAEIGAENVFDFSIGNPSVPAPKEVAETIAELLLSRDSLALHGYTSAQGDMGVRKSIADSLNRRYGADFDMDEIYMTCGAAAGLSICLNAVCVPGDEVLLLAPFFPEYKVFAEKAGAVVRAVPPLGDMSPDMEAMAELISEKTKAVIINSPNNPTGAIYSRGCLSAVAELLSARQREYGHAIYIISDEPYRELVYGERKPCFIPGLYGNTFICYSFSKSLSMPGERIGYIAVPRSMEDSRTAYAAVCGAGRALGYVCAPSLFQYVAAACCDLSPDLQAYIRNRELLCTGLRELGFEFVEPDGAFYLFLKSPEEDAEAFCMRARKHELLLVPSDSFGVGGYARVSYCVSAETITRSMSAFAALAGEYGLGG
ncbi:MAG: pyridoxal phosphate-dependent aminotransferase [Oscillospiraceae bacterium]|nr:pyridoxal phosphate-dependent aminotransferase [Oscillospiraceae bacterium]